MLDKLLIYIVFCFSHDCRLHIEKINRIWINIAREFRLVKINWQEQNELANFLGSFLDPRDWSQRGIHDFLSMEPSPLLPRTMFLPGGGFYTKRELNALKRDWFNVNVAVWKIGRSLETTARVSVYARCVHGLAAFNCQEGNRRI